MGRLTSNNRKALISELDAFACDQTHRENTLKEDCHVVDNIFDQETVPSDDGLALYVAREVDNYFRNSIIFDEDAKKTGGRIARLDRREIETGPVLGKGGFSTVREISKISLFRSKLGESEIKQFMKVIKGVKCRRNFFDNAYDQDEYSFDWEESDIMNQVHDRKLMDKHHMKGGEARYAVKMLHSSYETDPKQHFSGIIDLATEARFLSIVRHSNIIKMRAVALSDPYKSGFFLVLDRLYGTLADRVKVWFHEHRSKDGCIRQYFGGRKAQQKLFEDRLLIMLDIASAVQHLHSLGILYRDLKPENLGFDVKGRIKLFDFGLAVELRPENKLENGTYTVAPGGTRRYMPPEVVRKEPCNFTADVYSFAIMCWGVLKLDSAFKFLSAEKHFELVVMQNHRPEIPTAWSSEINSLLTMCWAADMWERPNFEEVVEMLDEITSAFDSSQKRIANTPSFASMNFSY